MEEGGKAGGQRGREGSGVFINSHIYIYMCVSMRTAAGKVITVQTKRNGGFVQMKEAPSRLSSQPALKETHGVVVERKGSYVCAYR